MDKQDCPIYEPRCEVLLDILALAQRAHAIASALDGMCSKESLQSSMVTIRDYRAIAPMIEAFVKGFNASMKKHREMDAWNGGKERL